MCVSACMFVCVYQYTEAGGNCMLCTLNIVIVFSA